MVKSLFDGLNRLVETHSAAKGIALQQATIGVPVPLHPGAERYFREVRVLQ
jgi:TRAP-type uncharacterized transport system substrate-binding protein